MNTNVENKELPITEAQIQKMLNFGDRCFILWDTQGEIVDCSLAILQFFGISTKEEFNKNFEQFSPAYQPNGDFSKKTLDNRIKNVFLNGGISFNWLHKKYDGRHVDCCIHLAPLEYLGQKVVCSYIEESFNGLSVSENYVNLTRDYTDATTLDDYIHVLLDYAPICCYLFNKNFEVIDCNHHAIKLLEMDSKGELNHTLIADNAPEFQPNGENSTEYAIHYFMKTLQEGVAETKWNVKTKSGKEFLCDATGVRIPYRGEYAIMVYLRESSEQFEFTKQMYERHLTERKLQAMLDSSPLCTFLMDENLNVVDCNQVAVSLFELNNIELDDKGEFCRRFSELSPEYQPDGRDSKEKFSEKVRIAFEAGNVHFEWMHITAYGEFMPCEVSIVKIELQSSNLLFGYIRDLRELKKAVSMKEHLEELAYKDHLTGLYNRRYFIDEAKHAFEVSSQNDRPFSVLMLDVDHFKIVNDTYSHMVGDEVLKILTKRILEVLREDSVVARYGGEEIIIMLKDTNLENALKVATRMQKNIAGSNFLIDDLSIRITASVGAASNANRNLSLQDIITNADAAMYRAKKAGRNTVSS